MGVVTQIRDRLMNVLSGQGTTTDKRIGASYVFAPLTGEQAEAAYRTSWLVRKIIDIPPFDMTREWRDWQAEGTDIEAIEAEEKRLQLSVKCQRALILARLYGGGALILGTADPDQTQPLNPAAVKKDGLLYVHVMSRQQLGEGQPRTDPADPWFGQPAAFSIHGGNGQQVLLHPSRVIAFVGQRAPEGAYLQSTSWFWGDPVMQSIGEAVKNADMAQGGFASLIDEAKLDIIKFPKLTELVATSAGEQQLSNRLAATAAGKSMWRMVALDAEDEWEQRQVTWSGMDDMLLAYLNIVAGAADIPLTRLLGVSPKGLQSNGDGEERDYHSMVKARQAELLCPALDRIDELLIRSALGDKPDDVYYEFAPLSMLSEKDAAEVEFKLSQTVKNYADTGLVPDQALSAIAQNRIVESGRWPGSETAFQEAENAPEEDDQDPDQVATLEARVAAMEGRGTVTAEDAVRLVTDAAARSLYVSRKLLNGDAFIQWAKGQGFEVTVPADELHVTIMFSRQAVDWMEMGSAWDEDKDGKLRVPPGGARVVEKLGDKGAVVLLFNSSSLSWRHEEMKRKGASFDYEQYQPHVTITYEGSDVDLDAVEPFAGELVFGPEIFVEVKDDWEQSITEE